MELNPICLQTCRKLNVKKAIHSRVLHKFSILEQTETCMCVHICINSNDEKRWPDCMCISQLSNQLVGEAYDLILLHLRGVAKWLTALCGN